MAARWLMRALAAATMALIALGLPGEALACPSCVLRENTPGRMFLLVGMILLPWTVVTGTVLAIRRTMRREARGEQQ